MADWLIMHEESANPIQEFTVKLWLNLQIWLSASFNGAKG
jgi:hypothetical protein